ncbi:hypothetical protein RhiirC2_786841 [Rhizophagus irregularis]|uniref:Uncharacterized protein n=1 Tax=Rhizophagus irregularis TaxID=588596 RepID=A0A2N1MTF4_9GLOM|nr:hypothetical protein RhiirC2_786841 [Rhizophagus irregularis]
MVGLDIDDICSPSIEDKTTIGVSFDIHNPSAKDQMIIGLDFDIRNPLVDNRMMVDLEFDICNPSVKDKTMVNPDFDIHNSSIDQMIVGLRSKKKQITKKRRDINIEKANHSNDDDDDDDDNDVDKTDDHKKPEVFQSKSNLEILVAWLVNHLEILRLALEMNKTDVAISSSSKITDISIKLT